MIKAAGGVVWRLSDAGVQVLLVHRPRYDDWSLPKGKCHDSETAVECALREVAEETGLRCRVGPELPAARYVDGKGRAKRVRYWAMQPAGGTFHPNPEVDVVRWVPLPEAAALLSYRHDHAVVAALPTALGEGTSAYPKRPVT